VKGQAAKGRRLAAGPTVGASKPKKKNITPTKKEKKVMAKDEKKAKYTKVGVEGAFDLYNAKGITPFKDAEKIPFSFRVPTRAEFPGLDADESKKFRKMLVEGAWAAQAKMVKLENDTQVVIDGEKKDLFGQSRKRIARYLNAAFATLKALKKEENGKVTVEETKAANRINALANRAVSSGFVTDNGADVNPLDADRFEPVA
jgi:hypothetical protein